MIVLPCGGGTAQRFAVIVLRAILVLIVTGCASTAKPPALPQLPVPQWEASKLIDSLSQRREQFRSVRSLARVNYAGPEGKHGFEEALLVQRPDRLRLETLTFLGAILIVTASDREIVGYHPREGVMVRGRSTKENLLRYTNIPLELNEITMLLVGLPPVDGSAPWRQDENTLFFSANGRVKDTLAFESQLPVPTKWQRFNGNGVLELTARFGGYIATPAGLFPVQIDIEAPQQGKKLEIRFQEPELNGVIAAESFYQSLPANVKELPIEAIGS